MWPIASRCHGKKNANSFQSETFPTVEMGGLEPPTPYMRNSSRAKRGGTKKARNRRKAS
jgi:hypothetical protein